MCTLEYVVAFLSSVHITKAKYPPALSLRI